MIGTKAKLFPGAGWFTIKVNKINSSREDSHQVRFQEDGGIEFMSVRTILGLQKEISVAVVGVGFKFCHHFCCIIYAGKVFKIKRNGKLKCRFNDGEIKDYSLQHLQKMYKKVYPVKDARSVGSEDEESDSDFGQPSVVDGTSDDNDEVIPDADEVESDIDIGQVVKTA